MGRAPIQTGTATRRPPPAYLLKIAFALIVIPAACLMRLLGIDRLGLRAKPGAITYWSSRAKTPVDLQSQT